MHISVCGNIHFDTFSWGRKQQLLPIHIGHTDIPLHHVGVATMVSALRERRSITNDFACRPLYQREHNTVGREAAPSHAACAHPRGP